MVFVVRDYTEVDPPIKVDPPMKVVPFGQRISLSQLVIWMMTSLVLSQFMEPLHVSDDILTI